MPARLEKEPQNIADFPFIIDDGKEKSHGALIPHVEHALEGDGGPMGGLGINFEWGNHLARRLLSWRIELDLDSGWAGAAR